MKDFFRLLMGIFRLRPVDGGEVVEKHTDPAAVPAPVAVDATGIDVRSLRNIRTLDVMFQKQVMEFLLEAKGIARKMGCEYVVICGTRTWAEQDALYAQGRTKPGRIVTKAKAGRSNHNFGIAFDCGVFRGGAYMDDKNPRLASDVHRACSVAARKHGLTWGGNWKFRDDPHYQLASTPAVPTEAMRVAYKKQGSVMV